jgi:hypothetical protein
MFSRLVLIASVLAAVPLGLAVGLSTSASLHAAAARQAAERHQETATLLDDAPRVDEATAEGPSDGRVLARATWAGPDGHPRRGLVPTPAGATAGSPVGIWVNSRGDATTRPLAAFNVEAQAIVAGALVALSLPSGVAILHLYAVWMLDAARDRRWTAEWAAIEPRWAGRTG